MMRMVEPSISYLEVEIQLNQGGIGRFYKRPPNKEQYQLKQCPVPFQAAPATSPVGSTPLCCERSLP